MEATQTTHTGETSSQESRPGARRVLRAIGERRLERRRRQMARNVKGRVRAFGRGARLGYAIRENPGRVVLFSFALGCLTGAAALALSHMVQDFQELLEEESPSEELSSESEAAA